MQWLVRRYMHQIRRRYILIALACSCRHKKCLDLITNLLRTKDCKNTLVMEYWNGYIFQYMRKTEWWIKNLLWLCFVRARCKTSTDLGLEQSGRIYQKENNSEPVVFAANGMRTWGHGLLGLCIYAAKPRLIEELFIVH